MIWQHSHLTYPTIGEYAKGLDLRFDEKKNHTTLLGIMVKKNQTRLPSLIHFPDMGTLRLEADKSDVIAGYDASRKEGEDLISISLPVATKQQDALSCTLTAVSIYPHFPGVGQEKFAGFRLNYLNLFQVNPRLQVPAMNPDDQSGNDETAIK